MKVIIISRHAAATEFIIEESGLPDSTPVFAGNVAVNDVAGAVVYGNLPLHLAAAAAAVVTVEFEGAPPRGAEYGLAEMYQAGARLRLYRIQSGSGYSSGEYAVDANGNFLAWADEITAIDSSGHISHYYQHSGSDISPQFVISGN